MKPKREYDIVIYGATGFTGSVIATEFIKRYACSNNINFKWAISGRNETKLKNLRKLLQNEFKQSTATNNKNKNQSKQEYINNLPIIIANVRNRQSLTSMISNTKLVISCIGPYRLLGEAVIEICALSGTHYVDICGEPEFMERCAFKYYDRALSSGAIIVNACGFDSIPSDIGCTFIDQFYTANNSMCSSIDGYLTGISPDGYCAHHTTLKAAVYGISNAHELRKLRKDIAKETDYKLDRKQIPRCGPKHPVNKSAYFWSDQVEKYSMLFPFADSAVVSNSQGMSASLISKQGLSIKNHSFPQYSAYISFNHYWYLCVALGIGGCAKYLMNYSWGQYLYLNYPYLMTFGVFSEAGPTPKQRKSQRFEFKFFAKGYSKHLCSKYNNNIQILNKLNCDFNVTASVKGMDIGYTGTAKIITECAITLLQDQDKIRDGNTKKVIPKIKGGVFTPSTVFANTRLIERLKDNGIIFKIEVGGNDKDMVYQYDEKEKKDNDDDNDDNDIHDDQDNAPDIEYDYNKYSNLSNDEIPH